MSSPKRLAVLPALALFVVGLCLILSTGCSTQQPIAYQFDGVNFTVRDPQFSRTVGQLLGPPLIPGNKVTTLVNGDEIFPAMLAAIASAQKTITFETYLFCAGDIGQQFADALTERARAGVKVHVLVDWFGSSSGAGGPLTINEQFVHQLAQAGASIYQYHVFDPFDPATWSQLDRRTHRKLLIVDGRIGFIGGAGIANEWTGHAQDPAHWRDNHYRVEGPVVAQLQAAFTDEWMESSGHVLTGDDYFPELRPAGTQWAQVFKSSANGGSANMQLMMLLSIAAAGKDIRIESAYFVPDDLTEHYLIAARKRGVRVQIILPGSHIDEHLLRDVSRSRWGKLLEAGVEIHEYQPTMLHCKQLIVDDAWVSVGSSNQDIRSFRINGEANLNVLDTLFAATQSKLFEDDKQHSRRITLAEWQKRSGMERIRTGWADLWGSEM
jgi:cardiolipin synthase A/B